LLTGTLSLLCSLLMFDCWVHEIQSLLAFGLLKQYFRRNFVSSLFDLMRTVDNSTVTGVHILELWGWHNGTVLVPVYDWATYLQMFFKKNSGISKYHHLWLFKEPGLVFYREFVDSPETQRQILKDVSYMPQARLPHIITLPRHDRKQYLFWEIRPFCCPRNEELVIPKPKNWSTSA